MAKRRIHSKGDYQQDEKVAAGTITPGMLIEMVSGAATVQAHATEGGNAERAFAVEDALQGNTVSDNYAAAALVTYILPVPGSCVNALLKAGYAYTVGMALISAADGTLKPEAEATSGVTVKQIIGECTEACDLSGSGAVNTLSEIRLH
jgi:hypothetical protein